MRCWVSRGGGCGLEGDRGGVDLLGATTVCPRAWGPDRGNARSTHSGLEQVAGACGDAVGCYCWWHGAETCSWRGAVVVDSDRLARCWMWVLGLDLGPSGPATDTRPDPGHGGAVGGTILAGGRWRWSGVVLATRWRCIGGVVSCVCLTRAFHGSGWWRREGRGTRCTFGVLVSLVLWWLDRRAL